MSALLSLERDVQQLVDLRLDLLDRILMDSGVERPERAEIVQAVEDQIFEMLDGRNEEATRESVLQLLRSLDPPEAYWAEGAPAEATARTLRGARREPYIAQQSAATPTFGPTTSKHSGVAIASFVLAMISIPTIIIFPVGTLIAIAALICGVIALPTIAASGDQLRGKWMAIVGCSVFSLHALAGLLLIMSSM
jgi:hypothetical protein